MMQKQQAYNIICRLKDLLISVPTSTSRHIYLKFVHEFLRRGSLDDDAASTGADEPVLHGLVDERQQGGVVAINVQQSNLMKTI